MAPQETTDVLEMLENSRLEFNAAVAGLSEDACVSSADAACWSALQCVEHVVMVEERFLGRIESAERHESATIDPHRESELSARLLSRATRVRAPAAVQPTGRFMSLGEAMDRFNSLRAETLTFARDRHADLYSLSLEHPRFGRLNGIELLLVIAAHARRHADQIRELREHAAS